MKQLIYLLEQLNQIIKSDDNINNLILFKDKHELFLNDKDYLFDIIDDKIRIFNFDFSKRYVIPIELFEYYSKELIRTIKSQDKIYVYNAKIKSKTKKSSYINCICEIPTHMSRDEIKKIIDYYIDLNNKNINEVHNKKIIESIKEDIDELKSYKS